MSDKNLLCILQNVEHFVLAPKPSLFESEIYFGLERLKSLCHSQKGVIIADQRIAKTHGPTLQKMTGFDLIAIPSEKTRGAKERLEDALFQKNIGKDSLLIALGGGALTDLVGFTASTYMRGITLFLIPTTLLGMVDAAIGGKTGIDTPYGKNTIGTLYLPKAVFISLDFLKTLPEAEIKNGLSEILKYGLIADSSLWNLAANWKQELPALIQASIACKCKIVESDFEEKTGLRRTLNFGHTVGHALEFLSDYQMPHGEAVALGCMAESYLSHILGYLSQKDFQTILALYQKLGYAFKKVDAKALIQAMHRDKKGIKGEARFVLIDQIGHAIPFDGEYCRSAPENKIDQMIEWMQHGKS